MERRGEERRERIGWILRVSVFVTLRRIKKTIMLHPLLLRTLNGRFIDSSSMIALSFALALALPIASPPPIPLLPRSLNCLNILMQYTVLPFATRRSDNVAFAAALYPILSSNTPALLSLNLPTSLTFRLEPNSDSTEASLPIQSFRSPSRPSPDQTSRPHQSCRFQASLQSGRPTSRTVGLRQAG